MEESTEEAFEFGYNRALKNIEVLLLAIDTIKDEEE